MPLATNNNGHYKSSNIRLQGTAFCKYMFCIPVGSGGKDSNAALDCKTQLEHHEFFTPFYLGSKQLLSRTLRFFPPLLPRIASILSTFMYRSLLSTKSLFVPA